MVAAFRRQSGFANRPLALRRCLVEILRRRDRLTAADMAAIAYARRIVVRPGHRRHVVPNAQLVAVRRALRKLVDKGRVEVLYRYRRRKIFVLRQEVEQ